MTATKPRAADRIPLSRRIRIAHRLISMLFLITVTANLAAIAIGTTPPWVTYSPLLPLLLLLGTGLYMLVKHYLPWEESGHQTGEQDR